MRERRGVCAGARVVSRGGAAHFRLPPAAQRLFRACGRGSLLPTAAQGLFRACVAARKTPCRLRQQKEPRARRRGIRCGREVVSSQGEAAAAAESALLHFTAAVGAVQIFHRDAPFRQVKHSVRSTEMMPPVQRMSPSMSSSTSNCRTMAAAPSPSSWVRS